jgi:hypothetical protein
VFAVEMKSLEGSVTENSIIKQFYGVWANEDLELVITGKIILLFLYKGTEYISALRTYKLNENGITLFTKAVAFFNKSNEKAICKYFSHIDNKWKEWGDKYNFSSQILKRSFFLKETETNIEIANNEETCLKLNKDTGVLTINSNFTKNQNLELIEKIEINDFRVGVKATKKTVGRCLAEWSLGAVFKEDDCNSSFSAEINTNRHSYTFTFDKWQGTQILYCRAARIRSNNNGSVFAQNIRMMKNNNEFTANMLLNNLEISKQDIQINNHLFNPESCVFINDGNEIYWSLKEFSEDEIILNGCGEEEYEYTRPITDNDNKEYFKYVRY